MSDSATAPNDTAHSAPYTIAEVGLDRPWTWLAKGWSDMRAAPGVSFGYGLLFVVVGLMLTALLYLLDVFYLVLPLALLSRHYFLSTTRSR